MTLTSVDGAGEREASRRLFLRHAALTLAIFAPLLLAFVRDHEYYPVVVYKMFYGAPRLGDGRGYTYYVFRGETMSGETRDIAPIVIMNALDEKIRSLVIHVIDNESLRFVRSPHPDNVKLTTLVGGAENLPDAAQLPDVLRAWGRRYNASVEVRSPQERLRRVRLDAYHWPQEAYADYDNYVKSWIVEL